MRNSDHDSHYPSTVDAAYVYVVPWSEFPIVPSNPHYPHPGNLFWQLLHQGDDHFTRDGGRSNVNSMVESSNVLRIAKVDGKTHVS